MAITCPQCQRQNPDFTLYCSQCKTALPQPFQGYRLGDLEIERPIAKGGFGAIYRAFHVHTHVPRAVKGILPQLADDPKIVARFQREARALAGLRHENIVEIIDIGVDHSFGMFIIMEWLEGETLLSFLSKRAPCPKGEVLYMASQILDALHVAHSKGMIHRDLKPENIMLTHGPQGRTLLKLLDFGLALLTDDEDMERLTTEGSMMGTPSYMAPEQIRGSHDIRPQADLYACGVLLAQLLTGRVPFNNESHQAIIYHKFSSPPISLAELAPKLSFSKALETFHQKALSSDPLGRFSSAQEMWKAFETCLAAEKIKLVPSLTLLPPPTPIERHRPAAYPPQPSQPSAPAPASASAGFSRSSSPPLERPMTGSFTPPPSAQTSFAASSSGSPRQTGGFAPPPSSAPTRGPRQTGGFTPPPSATPSGSPRQTGGFSPPPSAQTSFSSISPPRRQTGGFAPGPPAMSSPYAAPEDLFPTEDSLSDDLEGDDATDIYEFEDAAGKTVIHDSKAAPLAPSSMDILSAPLPSIGELPPSDPESSSKAHPKASGAPSRAVSPASSRSSLLWLWLLLPLLAAGLFFLFWYLRSPTSFQRAPARWMTPSVFLFTKQEAPSEFTRLQGSSKIRSLPALRGHLLPPLGSGVGNDTLLASESAGRLQQKVLRAS